ncbi:MAG: hypothetical protein AAF489_17200 [Bacteroidota bacterium]
MLGLIPTNFCDGYTKNLHYLLLHHSLETKEKSHHYVPGTDMYCAYCMLKYNYQRKEDEYHVFFMCDNPMLMWNYIKPMLRRLGLGRLDMATKILGINTGPNRNLINLLIFLAQRCIWQTKKENERQRFHLPITQHFQRKLYMILNRQKSLRGNFTFSKQFCNLARIENNIIYINGVGRAP